MVQPLPRLVLCRIFHWLRATDCCAAALVCRQWWNLLLAHPPPAWQHVELSWRSKAAAMVHQVRARRHWGLRSVSKGATRFGVHHCLDASVVRAVATSLVHLRSLDVSMCRALAGDDLLPLAHGCASLTALSLYGLERMEDRHMVPLFTQAVWSLCSCSIGGMRRIGDATVLALVQHHGHSLQHLNVEALPRVTSPAIHASCAQLPRLASLAVSSTGVDTSCSLAPAVSQLTKLSAVRCRLSAQCSADLVQQGTRLQQLSLSLPYAWRDTVHIVASLPGSLTRLRMLDVGPNMSAALSAVVARVPTLRHLGVDLATARPSAVQPIVSALLALTQLQTLDCGERLPPVYSRALRSQCGFQKHARSRKTWVRSGC